MVHVPPSVSFALYAATDSDAMTRQKTVQASHNFRIRFSISWEEYQ